MIARIEGDAAPSRPGRIARRRLIDVVFDGLARGPVLVEAPFGYGKSDLLDGVARAAASAGMVVHRLGGLDAPAVREALAGLDAGKGAGMETGLETASARGCGGPGTLVVIDDADAGLPDAVAWMRRLSGRMRSGIHLLLATRPLADGCALGGALPHTVAGPDDLAFTWDEFQDLADHSGAARRGTRPGFDEFRETGGWPWAVSAMLSARSRGGRWAQALDLGARDGFVSAAEREVYTALAFLPRYNRLVLAEILGFLGLPGSMDQVRLRALPATVDGGWVTLNPAVRSALRREAQTSSALDVAALQERAAAWFATAGAVEDAVVLATDLGDRQLVCRLVAAHGQELVDTGRIEPLVAVGRQFGPGDLPDPRALAPVAWGLMFGGGAGQARTFLREAHSADPSRSRTAALMEECLDVYTGVSLRPDRNPGAQLAHGDPYLDSVAVDLATLASIDSGLLEEAREQQAAFRAASIGRHGSCPLTYGEVLVALSYLLDDRPEEARFHAARAMGAAEALHGPRAPAAAFASAYLVDALFQLDRADEIAGILAGRMDVVEAVAFPDGAARAYGTVARVAMLAGQWDAAHDALERLDQLVRRRGWTVVQPFLFSEQARLALVRGNDKAAARLHERLSTLAQQPFSGNRPSPRFWDAALLRDLTGIRLAWVSGDRASAERSAERLAAGDIDGQTRAAVAAFLPQAASPARGHPLARLERLVFHRRRSAGDAAGLLDGGRSPAMSTRRACQALGLSEREEHIMGLLATGLSYKHIASATGLSVDTVKWHLKRIYQKLGVDGRSTAVLKVASLTGGGVPMP